MPVQQQLQIRRDTAANWTSTNPTLASGEWGLETDTRQYKIGDGTTAWNSLGYQLGPLLDEVIATDPDGAYFTGSGFTKITGAGNFMTTPDSNALDITGDIDIRVKLKVNNWSGTGFLIAKNATGQISYSLLLLNGKLTFRYSTNGTATTDIASSTLGYSADTTKWVRFTLDVDNGSSQNVGTFYDSDDGTTWNQISQSTNAGTITMFSGTSIVGISADTTGQNGLASSSFYRAQILNGIGGTTVFDADFSAVPADSFAFTESSSNAATVTLTTTRYSFGLPSVTFTGTSTNSPSANQDLYVPFTVRNKPITVKQLAFEVTTGPASSSNTYLGIYAADAQMQPTGNALYASSAIAVASGATGVGIYRTRITPLVLNPGNYLIAINSSVQTTYRIWLGNIIFISNTLSANPLVVLQFVSRTAAAFTNTPSKWNQRAISTTGLRNYVLLGWS